MLKFYRLLSDLVTYRLENEVIRKMETIKFWFYWNDTFSKFRLRDGQEITLYRYDRDCEGWSSEAITIKREGNKLTRHTGLDGRDCDGRLSQLWEDVATYPEDFRLDDVSPGAVSCCYQKHIGNTACRCSGCIAEYVAGVRVDFKQVESSQYDEYAEAANY